MRAFTILISILVGVALCVIFLSNQHIAQLNFVRLVEGAGRGAYTVRPLWQIVFGSVAVGALLGYLLGVTARPAAPHHAKPKAAPHDKTGEYDYLLGVNQSKNR